MLSVEIKTYSEANTLLQTQLIMIKPEPEAALFVKIPAATGRVNPQLI